jgi:hypothetical protein
MVGIVSAALLGGIAWIGLALYNTLKPNTKLETVEDIKQPKCSIYFESNIKQDISKNTNASKIFKNVR